MIIDPENPVVALCAAGMQVEGTPDEARRLFEQAWNARRDDYEASIAAHFLARHQPSPTDTLNWNLLAVRHAEAVGDDRVAEFMASLYLNLGDSYAALGLLTDAAAAADQATTHLAALPVGGYRDFVSSGVRRLHDRVTPYNSATSGHAEVANPRSASPHDGEAGEDEERVQR